MILIMNFAITRLKISGEELLSRCMSATTVFEPVDTSYALEELKSIIPTYSASFQFSGAANSPFRLEVDFRRRSTETEKVYHRWFNTHDEESGNVRRLPMQFGAMSFLRYDLFYYSNLSFRILTFSGPTGKVISNCSSPCTMIR
jgi:hypothetical protein